MSQECLDQLVADGTTNSTLLAAYALNLFFKSSAIEVDIERAMLLSEAQRHAEDAIEFNPLDALPHEVLGNILSVSGNRAGAIRQYERAVELAPSRPAPHFLLGWQQVLEGNWDEGMFAVEHGIAMQPSVPGYMIIPLALDAFRREQYEQSLDLAKEIIDRGDERGYSLAFAASVALGELGLAETYISDTGSRLAADPSDPMREVRVTFSNPDVMDDYEAVIAGYFSQ